MWISVHCPWRWRLILGPCTLHPQALRSSSCASGSEQDERSAGSVFSFCEELCAHWIMNFIGRQPAGPIHMQLTQCQPTSSKMELQEQKIRTLVIFPALLHVNYSDDRVKLLTLPVQLQSARVLGIPTDQNIPCTDLLKRSAPPSQESRRRRRVAGRAQRHGGAIPRAGGTVFPAGRRPPAPLVRRRSSAGHNTESKTKTKTTQHRGQDLNN